jgi:hypothetical protein
MSRIRSSTEAPCDLQYIKVQHVKHSEPELGQYCIKCIERFGKLTVVPEALTRQLGLGEEWGAGDKEHEGSGWRVVCHSLS